MQHDYIPTCIFIEYFKIKSNWFYLEFNGDVLVSLFSQRLFEQFYFSTKWLFFSMTATGQCLVEAISLSYVGPSIIAKHRLQNIITSMSLKLDGNPMWNLL